MLRAEDMMVQGSNQEAEKKNFLLQTSFPQEVTCHIYLITTLSCSKPLICHCNDVIPTTSQSVSPPSRALTKSHLSVIIIQYSTVIVQTLACMCCCVCNKNSSEQFRPSGSKI